MALAQAKISPTIKEKRYNTLQFLEACVISGNQVKIGVVDEYQLTTLSGEIFTHLPMITTYIIFNERPSVQLLRKYGWYREDQDILPIVAYIPTHLIYDKEKLAEVEQEKLELEPDEEPTLKEQDAVINYTLLDGTTTKQLVDEGESNSYILKPLPIRRGALIDIPYDYIQRDTSLFYVTDVKVDTVSINYVVNLMPHKAKQDPYGEEDSNTPMFTTNTRDKKL